MDLAAGRERVWLPVAVPTVLTEQMERLAVPTVRQEEPVAPVDPVVPVVAPVARLQIDRPDRAAEVPRREAREAPVVQEDLVDQGAAPLAALEDLAAQVDLADRAAQGAVPRILADRAALEAQAVPEAPMGLVVPEEVDPRAARVVDLAAREGLEGPVDLVAREVPGAAVLRAVAVRATRPPPVDLRVDPEQSPAAEAVPDQ